MLNKLEVYIADKDKKHKKFKEFVEADIEEKLQVPGGASLLAVVGYVYKQEAIKFSGGFLGIGGVLEGAKEVSLKNNENTTNTNDIKQHKTTQNNSVKNENTKTTQKTLLAGFLIHPHVVWPHV